MKLDWAGPLSSNALLLGYTVLRTSGNGHSIIPGVAGTSRENPPPSTKIGEIPMWARKTATIGPGNFRTSHFLGQGAFRLGAGYLCDAKRVVA